MKPKNAVYAAVGAPIVAVRALNSRLESLRDELESRAGGLGEKAQEVLEEWTKEGRQAVEKVSDGKAVDDFAARVDFDQAREQVGKLRDQLEDMLATWRSSFRADTPHQAREASAGKAKDEKATPAGGAETATEKAKDEKATPTGGAETPGGSGEKKPPSRSKAQAKPSPSTTAKSTSKSQSKASGAKSQGGAAQKGQSAPEQDGNRAS